MAATLYVMLFLLSCLSSFRLSHLLLRRRHRVDRPDGGDASHASPPYLLTPVTCLLLSVIGQRFLGSENPFDSAFESFRQAMMTLCDAHAPPPLDRVSEWEKERFRIEDDHMLQTLAFSFFLLRSAVLLSLFLSHSLFLFSSGSVSQT